MPRKRVYCQLANKYCRQSVINENGSICRLADKPLSEYWECVRDVIYKERHKVELWFSKEGWQMRHLFMRGTCFENEDIRIIIDYGGIAIQKSMKSSIRIKSSKELKKLLPSIFPDWLIKELSKKIK